MSSESQAGRVPPMQQAMAHHQAGRYDQAAAIYRGILRHHPNHPDALHLLGVALHQIGDHRRAVELIGRAIRLAPNRPMFHYNLGLARHALGRAERAVAAYRRAVELKPDHAESHYNMGNALQEMDRTDAAITAFRRAVEIKPDHANAWHNMGNALQNRGKTAEAIAAYRRTLTILPDHSAAFAALVHQLQHACDFDEVARLVPALDRRTAADMAAGRRPDETPFVHLTRHEDMERNLALARAWSTDVAARVADGPGFSHPTRGADREKLTVGYLSGDFRNHPVAHLVGSLFGRHDRRRFRVIGYSFGRDDGSGYREPIRRGCDAFFDLRSLDNAAAAARINQDGVDILVDMMGHTRGNRMEICALRPAPVQVLYLGYPGTSGADFIDYIVADRTVLPPDHARWYSEQPVHLPHTYLPTDDRQPVALRTLTRADCGLPGDGFVFCSFNQPYKIEPVLFDIWMRLLLKVPGSVLWLRGKDPLGRENLCAAAERRGVSRERLVFGKRIPGRDAHLARHRLADLVLDTRVFNGHSTTSDALWAGVPVVTLLGGHFASRVAASLLRAVGLPDLIARSPSEYEALALDLTTNPDRYRAVRQRLAKNRLTAPLFDGDQYVRHLETAFGRMWEIYRRGESPRPFAVETENRPAAGNPEVIRHRRAGDAALSRRDPKAAVAAYRRALVRDPEDVDARIHLGVALKALGRFDEAVDAYERVLAVRPDHPAALNNLGNALGALGRYGPAVDAYRRALARKPDDVVAMRNLANAQLQSGRSDAALAWLKRARKVAPDDPRTDFELGNVHRNRGRLGRAAESYRRALSRRPDDADIRCHLGITLKEMGNLDEALACYRRVLEQRPDDVNAVAGEADVLMQQGAFDDALARIRPLLDEGVESVNLAIVHAQLAGRFDHQADAVNHLEKLLKREGVTAGQRRQIHFELGSLYDEMERYDLAFAHFQRGNDLKEHQFDRERHDGLVRRLMRVYGSSEWDRLKRSTVRSDRPVFIVGLMRSGTTLVEQILDSHPRIRGAGELPHVHRMTVECRRRTGTDYPEAASELSESALSEMADDYLEKLTAIEPDADRVADKMPYNFMYLGLIAQLLPNARIIHCRRDPLDTGLSIYFQHFSGTHDYAYDLLDIGFFVSRYQMLMDHWRKVPDLPILEVQYEDLVSDPASLIRRILDFLGTDWDERCLRFYENRRPVNTASYQQVRMPLYTRSVGRWRHYARYLETLRRALSEPEMTSHAGGR
jgi:protein O-GlcNAc transferase